jgi:quinol monooxygenase YgiN
MSYGYLGTMRAKPGKGGEVVDLLLAGIETEPMPGCELYVVGTDRDDPDLLRISEVWTTKEAHDESLTLPAVRATIAVVMPLLTGEFTSHEVDVHGGFGLGQNRVG